MSMTEKKKVSYKEMLLNNTLYDFIIPEEFEEQKTNDTNI